MNEIITAIGILCSTHGNSSATNTLNIQRSCEKEMTLCLLGKNGEFTIVELNVRLLKCMRDLK